MAVDYICNPGKTDRKHSQSSDFQCCQLYRPQALSRQWAQLPRNTSNQQLAKQRIWDVCQCPQARYRQGCINKTVRKLKTVFGQHKASKDKGKLLWRLSKIILLGVTRGNKVVEFIKLPSTEKPKAELAGLIAHKAILQVELHKIH